MVVNTPPVAELLARRLGLNVFARGQPRHSRALQGVRHLFHARRLPARFYPAARALRFNERQLNSVVKELSDPGKARHHC